MLFLFALIFTFALETVQVSFSFSSLSTFLLFCSAFSFTCAFMVDLFTSVSHGLSLCCELNGLLSHFCPTYSFYCCICSLAFIIFAFDFLLVHFFSIAFSFFFFCLLISSYVGNFYFGVAHHILLIFSFFSPERPLASYSHDRLQQYVHDRHTLTRKLAIWQSVQSAAFLDLVSGRTIAMW